MTISKAVAKRISDLLIEHKISRYRLAKNAAIPQDTLKSIFQNKSEGVYLKTVLLICKGFGITAEKFFDDEIFNYENIDFK